MTFPTGAGRWMVLAFILTIPPLHSQTELPSLVTISTFESAVAGDEFALQVRADIDPRYHIYGTEPVEGPIPTEVTVDLPGGLAKAGPLKAPGGVRHFDEGFGVEVTWLSGRVVFEQPIRIVSAVSEAEIRVRLLYQACTETYCLPPKTAETVHAISKEVRRRSMGLKKERAPEREKTLRAEDSSTAATMAPDSEAGKAASEASLQSRLDSYDKLRGESLWSFIGLALLTGLLALLTPCVFPMIPITVSFFTKYSDATRVQALRKSLVYVGGIVASFTLFGWLMSLIVGATGAQNFAANVWVNLAIGLLFVAFAMSLFGVFEIRLPAVLVNFSQRHSDTGGNIGILFAGITFTLVSFTCTVQFLGILMVASASGEWFLPIIGMLCFAAAFSAPFFFLSLFPQYLASLPKSGGWLHATKIVMALVELAAAFKFFSNVDLVWDLEFLTRPALLSVWIVLFGLSGFYLLGKIHFSADDQAEQIGFGRTSLAMLFLSLTVYLVYGLFGNPLQADIDSYLPPLEYGRMSVAPRASEANDHWIENYDEALRRARQTGRSMFVDFTGKTCTNCRLMEKTMFVREDVRALFDRMILVRLWTDFGERQEFNQALQQRLVGSVALPFYAVVDPQEHVRARFGGLERDPEVFKAFLRSGLGPVEVAVKE
jgi:thiol:disulfide interchange protein DsbD